MTGAGEQTLTRVESRDRTEIGCFCSGEGPPLLLVHGLLGDHTRWDALRPCRPSVSISGLQLSVGRLQSRAV